jgi:hypothetical protein
MAIFRSILYFFNSYNGLHYPPPMLAKLLTYYCTNSPKMPLNPHAEGGRVGAVLGSRIVKNFESVMFGSKFFLATRNGHYLLRLYPIESPTFPKDVSHEHYSSLYAPLYLTNSKQKNHNQ